MFIHNNFETMCYHTVKAFDRYNRQLWVGDTVADSTVIGLAVTNRLVVSVNRLIN